MLTLTKTALRGLLLVALSAAPAPANTVTAASCSTSAVQAAITSAATGDTVLIPSGTCAWTSGVTTSGKGITLQGAGSGRIIAYDNGTETPTIGTGTKTFTIGGYSPGFSASSIAAGETLMIFENNNQTNYMQGTVTSINGAVLTMNITVTSGTGSTHRWLIATIPSTIIVHNSSTPLFSITENTSVSANWSGIQVALGTGTAPAITPLYASGGRPILIHDCWIQQNGGDSIDSTTNRGVIWNCSFNGSSGNNGQLVINSAVRIKGAPASSWTTASTWGAADTTGTGALYVETSDFHAYQAVTDNDDAGRMVWRYNLVDHSTFSTHGADTSNYGQRYFEYYNNTGVFNGYNDGTTFNLANGWIGLFRGGSAVIYNNNLPPISSTDYGTKPDLNMTVMNLERNGGPNACWGSGTTAGSKYHAPRQVGMGYVTGAGTDGLGRTNDSITYVGDTEPVYMWANNRTLTIGLSDYPSGQSDSCSGTPDSTANYIKSGRDYFNGSTAKPGWAPYTYPHPLAAGSQPPPPTPLPPTTVQFTIN